VTGARRRCIARLTSLASNRAAIPQLRRLLHEVPPHNGQYSDGEVEREFDGPLAAPC
jgi:hypothetical protein